MKASHILISAYNINSGGGKLLLDGLLHTLPENSVVSLFADARLKNTALETIAPGRIHVAYVKNGLLARIAAEYGMKRVSREVDVHLCLGNLPPLFGSQGKVITYVHSRYLVDHSLDRQIPLRKYLVTQLERFWFRLRLRAPQVIWVQTPTMKELVEKKYGEGLAVQVKAFLPELPGVERKTGSEKSFIYVAAFDPHKNHHILIEAWARLKQEGIHPRLTLVFPQIVPEDFEIAVARNELNIELVANSGRDELYAAYARADCLIHPSLFESFGIVLVEAQKAGLDIIAPEADYVRDVVHPCETFDPRSAKSVARSVKRYLQLPEEPVAVCAVSEIWRSLFP